jgi:hypothetical protein
VVAKALSRFYPVFEELAGGMPVSTMGLDGTARFLADGQYRNPGGDPANFTTSYFHRPEELPDEMSVRPFTSVLARLKMVPGTSSVSCR